MKYGFLIHKQLDKSVVECSYWLLIDGNSQHEDKWEEQMYGIVIAPGEKQGI